jgi:Tfp pilus assembly protein PilX
MNKKGFTLLFAVLISSLLLSIGIAILDLTLKEFLLSSAGRESQLAFYAADDAMECALYWDHNTAGGSGSSFATSSESTVNPSFACNGQTITPPAATYPSAGVAITVMHVPYSGNVVDPCANVVVTKTTTVVGGFPTTATIIDSRGYDTCDSTNPQQTERGIQSNY